MNIRTKLLRPLGLVAVLFAGTFYLAGCDIAQILGINEVDVNLGATGEVQLEPQGTSVSSGSVNIGQELPLNPRVREIILLPESIVYTPPAGRDAGDQHICPLDVWILVNDVAAVDGMLTVNDETGAVTDVNHTYARAYNRSELCAAWPGIDPCPLAAGNRSSSEIRSHVDEALQSGQFNIALIVDNPGECAGMLGIQQLRFDIRL